MIPATLHDLLMARLDQMGAAKGTAQLAATIGREFGFALLQAVASAEEETLRQDLRRLIDAELLYQRGVGAQATYVFKHALIQEAAYTSLLRRTRQHYHQWIAQALETQFPEVATVHPELVAHHYTEAGLHAQALPYWHRAGRQAAERSAHTEVIAHLTKGLELLTTLPDVPERTQQELTLYLTLGPSLMATKGWAAPEVENAYTRALDLCRQLGETPQLFQALLGLSGVHVVRAEPEKTQELGEQLLRLAQCQQDPVAFLGAYLQLGGAAFGLGAFALARQHFEQTRVFYDSRQHRSHVSLLSVNLGVFGLAWGTHPLWLLGYPNQALTQSHEALTLAQELSHPLSQALALAYAAMLQQFRRDDQAAYELAEATKRLCTEHGFMYYLAWATILQGWALVRQEHDETGIAQMGQGLAALQDTGAKRSWAYYCALLAETYGNSGEPNEGLRILTDAFDHVQRTGECWWEAELYRLKGELLLQAASRRRKAEETPEACFRQALEVARRQQAKALELCAVMSLSRLWQQQGRREAARQLLAEVYGWFSEGFDTVDLQHAKALLAQLA